MFVLLLNFLKTLNVLENSFIVVYCFYVLLLYKTYINLNS